jgi:2-oxoglutarate dehydrogenase E2 component (dihydrolipoamide succinyltransferase)
MTNNKSHEIKVPVLPESVADAVVISWYKKVGDIIKRDEPIVDIETDKVVLEVPSPVTGVIAEIHENEGSTVVAQQTLGLIKEQEVVSDTNTEQAVPDDSEADSEPDEAIEAFITPSAKKLIHENRLEAQFIKGSGKGGRILKEDVLSYLEGIQADKSDTAAEEEQSSQKPEAVYTEASETLKPAVSEVQIQTPSSSGSREEKRVPMSRLRARIAERLVNAQHQAAILTTFNEVNMKPVMDLRSKYKELFEKTHQVKLGFMSFFVKAVVEALKQFPAVNASIDGSDIVYHGYFDIGIAVSSPRGLVVPVLKNSELLSMADIEQSIKDFSIKAKENTLTMDDITGGTFSITNGGVFGSLLSTPILNPPQSGILGMHKIEQRPVVENGEIVIRPIMYVALSYDHRIIDGREAVQFLVAIKNYLEDPSRLLLEI